MVSRTLSVLATLIPAIAFANAVADENPEIQQAVLETWSDEQLCRARDIPEALDELERRDLFDGHELRAIRREDIREGISEDALLCLKGSPQTIFPAITTFEGDAVDAFVYPPGTIGSLIVYIRRQGDVSTVAAFTENAEPYMFPSWSPGPDFCAGAVTHRPRGDACWPATTATHQHRLGIDVLTDPPTIYPPHPSTLPSQ